MAKAISEADDATRTQDWKDVMKIANADIPDVPLVWAGSYLGTTTHVHGYITSPTQSEYFNLVWKDAGGWHVLTVANAKGGAVHFRGVVSVKDGKLGNLHGVLTGKKDRFITGPDEKSVTFDFATRGADEKDPLDGISFTVSGADAMLTFKLEIGEADPKFDGDRIFIGENGKHPKVNAFTLSK